MNSGTNSQMSPAALPLAAASRAADRGPNVSRATAPLNGTGTARPAGTTYGGSGTSAAGATSAAATTWRVLSCNRIVTSHSSVASATWMPTSTAGTPLT